MSKWLGGAGGFVGYISGTFAETWIPGVLITISAWAIIISELILGLWLLIGKKLRLAWVITAGLMFMLMLGQTVIKEYGTVANNWQYLVIAIVAASLVRE